MGYELITRSLAYGGTTITTTDFAVAAGLCNIGDSNKVSHLDKSLVERVLMTIRQLLEDSIDQVKVENTTLCCLRKKNFSRKFSYGLLDIR